MRREDQADVTPATRARAAAQQKSNVYQQFREICLALPESTEVFVEAWGHPTFRVGPKLKMFASCSAPDADSPSLGMKVEKAHQQALVHTDERVSAAAYVGKHGWINIDASGPVDWAEVREWVLESYCLNASKRLCTEARKVLPPCRPGSARS